MAVQTSLFHKCGGCLCLFLGLQYLRFVQATLPGVSTDSAGYPTSIHLRAGILTNAIPLAYVADESIQTNRNTSSPSVIDPYFQGFQPDFLRELQKIAFDLHNISLTVELTEAPAFSYIASFDLLANDCNTTGNPHPAEDCNQYDLLVGDYYAFYPRPLRAPFTPPLLTTAAAAVKYVHRTKRDMTTLAEAEATQEPVCLHNDSYYDGQTLLRYPNLKAFRCTNHDECLQWLKEEDCVLFVEDALQLKYLTVHDPELEVTREQYSEQFVLWPMNARLDDTTRNLLVTWIYQAKELGVLDALYDRYFSVNFCPIGKSGLDCDQPCNPSHGVSDRFGQCVCDTTRYTGDDCSIEIEEELNLIAKPLLWTGYALVIINFTLVAGCTVWLVLQRNRAQVKIAQPFFLLLILFGCVISTSTILAMSQEDSGTGMDGPDSACMAIPWLYSVGFSITFGTLFAKIRRIYILLQSAAEMKRVKVEMKETTSIVGLVLLIDVVILSVWTIVDPLIWTRTIITADKYGYALESVGSCDSEAGHWVIFVTVIGTFHFVLMGTACYMCYLARGIPNRFSNGKYVGIAMFSNIQILIVATPILIVLGTDPQNSFFVRAVAIWINDFVVVTLIFGSLIYNVHYCDFSQNDSDRPSISRQLSGRMTKADMDGSQRVIQAGLEKYAERVGRKSLDKRSSSSNRGRGDGSTTEFDFSAECSRPRRPPTTLRAVSEISAEDSVSRAPNSRGSSIMSLFSSSSTEEEPVAAAAADLPELAPLPVTATLEAHPRAA